MRYLLVIVLYSMAQIALGLWISGRATGSSDFFVAGRRLGPGLLFATFLAANMAADRRSTRPDWATATASARGGGGIRRFGSLALAF
jgi:Na+/proline symporter